MSDLRPSKALRRQASCARRNRASAVARWARGRRIPARLVVLADLVLAAGQRDKLHDSLQELATRATRWTKNDDLKALREREARAEDGYAVKHTGAHVSARARAWVKASAHLNVLPNRRGVLMSTSLLLVSQPCAAMMAGRSVAHEER